jgi:hypothetical protein
MIKMQQAGGCGNNRFTNMINIHTCTVGCPNFIIAVVALMHGQFLQLVSDVISSTGIKVPIWINTSRWTCHRNKTFVGNIIFIEAVPTYIDSVTHFEHLTLRALLAIDTSGG